MNQTEILRIEALSKSFPGVQALTDITISFKQGTVHSILGENGAGKSTFMNIVYGVYPGDTGKLIWHGKETVFASPLEAQKHGIAMIHQENSLIPFLSVMDNIYLGHYPKKGAFIDTSTLYKQAKALLEELNIYDISPTTEVVRLSVAQKQLVEIVKALSLKPRLIMMDEPTAALTQTETDALMKIIEMLRKNGVTIVYVSHRLEEVFDLSDEISILRDGKLVRTVGKDDITIDEAVRDMVGRDLEKQELVAHTQIKQDEKILEVKNFSKKDKFHDISFDVKKGEVLGFGGLVGAGRSEIMEAIFGYEPADSGEIWLKGKKISIKHPSMAVAAKMGMVPEERKEKGLFLRLSVKENMNVVSYKRFKRFRLLKKKLENAAAQKYVDMLSVKTPTIEKRILELSGGNQQKAILARWMQTEPELLILDEPTHGVDVGAKAEIYKLIREMADSGVSILLISSEMPELIRLSDRIVIIADGRLKGVLDKHEMDQEVIMQYATNQVKNKLGQSSKKNIQER
ncbi:MAG: sugar ABC transporter ATP-binding protein [Eubacteriales bacterium]